MKIQVFFIDIFLDVHNSFLALRNPICKCLHFRIQIVIMKNPVHGFNLVRSNSSRHLEHIFQFLCRISKRLCKSVHPEHSSEQSDDINHCYNTKKNKVIEQYAHRIVSYIKSHSKCCRKHSQKQYNIHDFFLHSRPP